jgi:small subunit ribosomal protein S20
MANTPSARKRVRRNNRRAEINTARHSRLKTFLKKIEQAIAGGDAVAAQQALVLAQPELSRSAAKGLIHKNAASRKVSRLSSRIKKLKTAN